MTTIDIETLRQPIQQHFERFEEAFRATLRSEITLINTIHRYILAQEGKKIRPILLLLSARLCGEPNHQSYVAASLVEILHTATLVHDDIVDESDIRRGQPSVRAIWKNQISVLLGDYLFSKSLRNMLSLRNFEALDMLAETSELLSSGELLQLEKSYRNTMDEEVYYQMIWAKTASLFATACKLGAITGGAEPALQQRLWAYGRNLGMAFQIKDDLFDCTGSKAVVGKPTGRDIKSNLITLPLLYTLQALPDDQSSRIREQLKKNLSDAELSEICALIEDKGGLRYTRAVLRDFSRKAREQLKDFPDSAVRESLAAFVDFNEARTS